MAQMNTDAAVLAKEAANFERISGELKGVIAHVESTAGSLPASGTARRGLLPRPHSSASTRRLPGRSRSLNDISANIHTSGTQYTSTDDDQTSALSSAMNL